MWFSKGRESHWSMKMGLYVVQDGSRQKIFRGNRRTFPEVKGAVEIMAVWLPNFSHPTGRGKYFLEGKSGESGFISWKEGETLCYVSDEKGNILQTNGKPEQYKGFKGRGKKRYRHLLGTALLDYFAPWR